MSVQPLQGEPLTSGAGRADVESEPERESTSQAERVAQLFKAHNQALVNYLAVRLRSLQEAKEVAQEAYVRLLRLDRPGTASFLRVYLFKIASNLAIDRQRRRGRYARFEQTALLEEVAPGLDEPERRLLAGEALQTLGDCLRELPEKCSRALVMYRLDGLGQETIARRLGVTPRMVRYYLTYALDYCRLRVDGATPEQARECAGR